MKTALTTVTTAAGGYVSSLLIAYPFSSLVVANIPLIDGLGEALDLMLKICGLLIAGATLIYTIWKGVKMRAEAKQAIRFLNQDKVIPPGE